jgi:hypothetical protein
MNEFEDDATFDGQLGDLANKAGNEAAAKAFKTRNTILTIRDGYLGTLNKNGDFVVIKKAPVSIDCFIGQTRVRKLK